MDLLSFVLGAIAGGLVTFGVLRRLRAPARPPRRAPEAIVPPTPDVPAASVATEEKVLDLDAQRLAAAARIRDQRAASRALREAQRVAAEEDARIEAQRLADEENARAEAQRWAAEERARAQAQRLADEAAAQAEAQRLAAEASERAQAAQRLADEAAVQAETLRLEAEKNARAQAQRLAEEAAAQAEAQRLAAEESERVQAQRLADETAAQAEAQRLAEEAAAAVAATPPAAVAPLPETKPPSETLVMIVDDSKVGRIKTNRLLLNHAFQVQMAVDGRDAVQKITERMPDLVITDVEMPEMDGFELTLHIRQDPTTAHLPVIIVSGNNDEYAARAHEVGADFMLGKPYTDSDMIGHVQRLLRTGR